MNKNDANKILALLKANYSYAFKNMPTEEKYALLNAWTMALADIDPNAAIMAIIQLISKSKWIPTVAEIREQCRNLYFEAQGALAQHHSFPTLSAEEVRSYEAVVSATQHLRGVGAPELPLDAILRNQREYIEGGLYDDRSHKAMR